MRWFTLLIPGLSLSPSQLRISLLLQTQLPVTLLDSSSFLALRLKLHNFAVCIISWKNITLLAALEWQWERSLPLVGQGGKQDAARE